MVDVVGRGSELSQVVRWFEHDGPPTLLLEGPPGLGKTTVWSAAMDDLRARGAHVLTSAPTEAESGLSYSGLADLLTDDLDEIRPRLPLPKARALAVALRLEDPAGRPVDQTAVTRGALDAFRAVAAVRGRVLLAIDDLRWLDGPSLAVVVYVARRLGPKDPIRILTTHRTGAPEPVGLDRALAIERVSLGPVSVGGIHRIVRQHAGVSLPRPRLLEIHAATLGNPLHAIEPSRAFGPDRSGEPTADGSLASLFGVRIGRPPGAAAGGPGLDRRGRPTDRTGRFEAAGRAIRRRVRRRVSARVVGADLLAVAAGDRCDRRIRW